MRGATSALPFRAYALVIFQPTRPLRGATDLDFDRNGYLLDFNPRAPCGARQALRIRLAPGHDFNPRAPCGARRGLSILIWVLVIFQPTRPLRGATPSFDVFDPYFFISTHAPLAGRDLKETDERAYQHISTHAPLAGRDGKRRTDRADRPDISTHAPLAGRDSSSGISSNSLSHFNPRAPCGARQLRIVTFQPLFNFNPRAPCGARPSRNWLMRRTSHFNPRAPCGARRV